MATFFVFVDGIGAGVNSSDNPLATSKLQSFSSFTGKNGFHKDCKPVQKKHLLYKTIDANIGVKGLPQSGTGQTTLFTGINGSKVVGRHFGPYPHSKLKPLLQNDSLFHKVLEIGKKPHFLNAYPDIFFEKSEKRNRWSCTTLMVKSAGIRLNRIEDILNEKAITAEIIQSAWRSMLGLDVPKITPQDAAKRALRVLKKYDFVLYEYYLTDKAGHSQNREKAYEVLDVLNQFLFTIIQEMDRKDTLLITSDHGNIEDLSTKSHTKNPVPLFVKGGIEPFKNVKSILGITPAILKTLNRNRIENPEPGV